MGVRVTDALVSFYLAMVVYFTDGTPAPQMFILPVEVGCDFDVAARYARSHVPLPEGVHLQDWTADPGKLKFLCLPIYQGTPGPALKPVLQPGQEEASAE